MLVSIGLVSLLVPLSVVRLLAVFDTRLWIDSPDFADAFMWWFIFLHTAASFVILSVGLAVRFRED